MPLLSPLGPGTAVRAARRWTRLLDRRAGEVFSAVACLLLGPSAWQWRSSDPASARVAMAGLVVAAGVGLGVFVAESWRRRPVVPCAPSGAGSGRRSPGPPGDAPHASSSAPASAPTPAPAPVLVGPGVGSPR